MLANSYMLGQIAAEQRLDAERDAAMDRLIRQARELQSRDDNTDQGATRLGATMAALMCLVVCRPVRG